MPCILSVPNLETFEAVREGLCLMKAYRNRRQFRSYAGEARGANPFQRGSA
jgi:hypothetical protein